MRKALLVIAVLAALLVAALPVSADGPPTHCPGWPNHAIPPGWAKPCPCPGPAGMEAGPPDHSPGNFPHTIPPGWAKKPG